MFHGRSPSSSEQIQPWFWILLATRALRCFFKTWPEFCMFLTTCHNTYWPRTAQHWCGNEYEENIAFPCLIDMFWKCSQYGEIKPKTGVKKNKTFTQRVMGICLLHCVMWNTVSRSNPPLIRTEKLLFSILQWIKIKLQAQLMKKIDFYVYLVSKSPPKCQRALSHGNSKYPRRRNSGKPLSGC